MGSPRIPGMRVLIQFLILWSFAAQSLALVAVPACDYDAENGNMMAMAADHASHGTQMVPDRPMTTLGDSSDENMPCCESAATSGMDLCQLTCASGGCSLAMAPQNLLPQTLLNPAPYQALSFTPIPPTPQNLLRPPRGA